MLDERDVIESRGVVVSATTNTKVPGSIPVWDENFRDLMFGSPLTPFASMVLREWLTRVKREPYLLHVKDTLVAFEKEQANAATRQHSRPQSGKGLIQVEKLVSQSTINKYV